MSEGQRIARTQVGPNISFEYSALDFVVDQDHDDVAFFGSIGDTGDLDHR